MQERGVKRMKEYHKIDSLYMREEATKRLLPGVYRNPAVAYLKDNEWTFTEKIDGTNIRVVWDLSYAIDGS